MGELAECRVVRSNGAVMAEDHDGYRYALDHRAREISRVRQVLLAAPQLIDIEQQYDQTFNLVVRSAIGTHAQQLPPSIAVLNFELSRSERFQNLIQNRLDVFDAQVQANLADGATDVGRTYIQESLHRGSELADMQIAAEHQQGNIDAVQQVG